MSIKFTPSVWKANDKGQILSPCIDGSVSLVATVNGYSDEARGNAKLIASAPEMYWSLCNILFELKRGNWSNPEYVKQARMGLENFLNKLNEEEAMLKRTSGKWLCSFSRDTETRNKPEIFVEGKCEPLIPQAGDLMLISHAPEMYELLWQIADELDEALHQGVITEGIYRVVRKMYALLSEMRVERHGNE